MKKISSHITYIEAIGNLAIKMNSRQHLFFYLYDELNRKTQTIVFDEADPQNVEIKVLEIITYGTDEATNSIGQIAEICAQDGKTTFEYDFKGNIVSLRKQFTEHYNMITNWDEQVDLQIEQFEIQTAYDALNRPVTIIHPNGTCPINYVYDKGGLLQKVLEGQLLVGTQTQVAAEHVTNITYNAKGQRKNIYYGNNTKTRYDYNPLNFRLSRLLTTRNMGQEILQNLNYEYDAVGNITQITDNAQQTHYFDNQVIAPVATFEYDALYRLTKATGRELTALTALDEHDFANDIPVPNIAGNAMQNYLHNYQYDALGNILSDDWKTYQYATENNFLLGNDNMANLFTYDEHGNMLAMPHLDYLDWDYNDRLFSAGNGTFTSYYHYDIEGNRTRKVVNKSRNIVETRYYIGGYEVYRKEVNGVINTDRFSLSIYDMKEVKQTAANYVTPKYEIDYSRRIVLSETTILEGGLLFFPPMPVIRYQYSNHLGSACLELNEDGDIISYEEYHPFGSTSYRAGRSETEVSQKRYKYCGKERDEETGLYYFGARFYAAWLCRFVSCDSKQFDYPQVNPYNYCLCNPVNLIDPTGMSPEDPNNAPGFGADKKGSAGNPIKLEGVGISTGAPSATIQGNNASYNFTDTGIKPFVMERDPSGGLGIYAQPPQPIQLVEKPLLPFVQQNTPQNPPNTGEIRPAKSNYEKNWEFSAGPFANYIKTDPIVKSVAVGGLAVTAGLAAGSAATTTWNAATATLPGISSTVTNAYNAAATFYGTTAGQVVTGVAGGYILNQMDAGPDVTLPDPLSNTISQGIQVLIEYGKQIYPSDSIRRK